VQLQLKTWPFVEDYLKTKTGIIIPIGSTEQHGPTGLIGTDALTAEMIGRGVGEKVGALVAPTISVGMAQHHLDFPGSVTLRPTTLIAVVRDNALRLGEMIDALLTFSRLGRQALKSGPLDMTDLARNVADELLHGAKDHAPAVHIEPLPNATGDRTLMRQVFANLLGNAFKFTRGRPAPRIEIGARSAGGETVYLVRDNGAGFDMRYADKLFQVFSRLHHADEFEGTGVGLALVQRIIQRHHGRIWAEGVPNQGATFYFALPRETQSP
jgi:light-regulated signal transduction histidine kinase (bacteriophytochrome)